MSIERLILIAGNCVLAGIAFESKRYGLGSMWIVLAIAWGILGFIRGEIKFKP